jgi:hypothetical protein
MTDLQASTFCSAVRVLIAEPTGSLRTWIDLALSDAPSVVAKAGTPAPSALVATEVVDAEDGREVRDRLFSASGPGVDVVVANARLPGLSTMQVLAQARAAGLSVPFIVVRGFHGRRLHIFVGEPDGARLTSRVVDATAFRDTVLALGQEARRSRAA